MYSDVLTLTLMYSHVLRSTLMTSILNSNKFLWERRTFRRHLFSFDMPGQINFLFFCFHAFHAWSSQFVQTIKQTSTFGNHKWGIPYSELGCAETCYPRLVPAPATESQPPRDWIERVLTLPEIASKGTNNGLKSRLDMKDKSKYITISLPTSTWSHCFVGIEANSGSVYCFKSEAKTIRGGHIGRTHLCGFSQYAWILKDGYHGDNEEAE